MGIVEDPLGTSLTQMSPGLAGVDETIVAMSRLALQGSGEPRLRSLVETAITRVPARDWRNEARCVEGWVRRHLHYVRDGLKIETLKTVPRMLAEIAARGRFQGDCDDASILSAAALLTIGHSPAFLVLGRGNVPHHVCVYDRTSGQVVDPTGEPRGPYSYRKVYDVIPAV